MTLACRAGAGELGSSAFDDVGSAPPCGSLARAVVHGYHVGAMSKSNTLETAWLSLFFQAAAIAGIADNASTSPATEITLRLHTADPTDSGTPTTSEADYPSYAAVTVARTAGGWDVTGDTASNVGTVQFPQATGPGTTLTHMTASVGTLFMVMELRDPQNTANPNPMPVISGTQPEFAAGTITFTED